MNQATNRLSLAASAMLRLQQKEQEVADDLAAFHAPSECAAIAFRSIGSEEREQLASFGFTPASFNEALKARTSERFSYFSGLLADEWELR